MIYYKYIAEYRTKYKDSSLRTTGVEEISLRASSLDHLTKEDYDNLSHLILGHQEKLLMIGSYNLRGEYPIEVQLFLHKKTAEKPTSVLKTAVTF